MQELFNDACYLEKLADNFGRLSAVSNPLLSCLFIDMKLAGILGRIISSDLIDKSAVSGAS